MTEKKGFVHHYTGIFWLLAGIALGSLFGIFLPQYIGLVKPIGDIFLNLLFTAVTPLVFFAISSVIANLGATRETGRLISTTISVFLITVLIASLITLLSLYVIPITIDTSATRLPAMQQQPETGNQIVQLFTVTNFTDLLARKSMLALILFSVLIGISARLAGPAGTAFRAFLASGNAVMKSLLHIIMKLGPLGLGAYFAYQVATIGPQLFGAYAQTLAIVHGVSIFYYLGIFTAYAAFAGGKAEIIRYWKNNITPSITALATCSSIATIPANLEAAAKMGIPEKVTDLAVPFGATLHKEGSAIAAVVKAAIALALVHQNLHGWEAGATAIFVALLVSIIEGGIPNGGYVGEMLIVSAYHLPPEALPIMMIIGTLVDPIATLLNATGDTASGLLIGKFLHPPKTPAA